MAAPCAAIPDCSIAQIFGGAADLDQLVCDNKMLRGSIKPTAGGGSAFIAQVTLYSGAPSAREVELLDFDHFPTRGANCQQRWPLCWQLLCLCLRIVAYTSAQSTASIGCSMHTGNPIGAVKQSTTGGQTGSTPANCWAESRVEQGHYLSPQHRPRDLAAPLSVDRRVEP